MTEQERRKSIRTACEDRWIEITAISVSSQTQSGPKVQVKVDNVSGTGVCLISSIPFELGQEIVFSESDMPAKGSVVWTCQSKVECKAGIQFS